MAKSMQKLNPLNVPFCVLLDISFQKYIRLSKINVRGEKIKSRKYCEQRWSIPELRIHLPFLIVLAVENIAFVFSGMVICIIDKN